MPLPCTKGKQNPQVINPAEKPMFESRHHSVNETSVLGSDSMKKSAPRTTGHDKPSFLAHTVKPMPKATMKNV